MTDLPARIGCDSEVLADARAGCRLVRERIVKVRNERGLTAAEAARRVGISRPFYTQIECGTRRMNMAYFLAICKVLSVDPGELLKQTGSIRLAAETGFGPNRLSPDLSGCTGRETIPQQTPPPLLR